MKRTRSGSIKRGPVELTWGEWRREGRPSRYVALSFGTFPSAGPSPYVRIRMNVEPSKWHRQRRYAGVHVEVLKNQRWILDFHHDGNEYLT